jgi:signal peptidase
MASVLRGLWQDVQDMQKQFTQMDWRFMAYQCVQLGMVVCSVIMIWKALVVGSGSESPVVVVLSGSMEPAFFRGDILFLWLGAAKFQVGEIVVFKIKGREVPIVHRILEIHVEDDQASGGGPGKMQLLTKGDNNPGNDRLLYNAGQLWLDEEDVVGRVTAFLPYLGQVTIRLTDYPMIKYALVGGMGLLVILAPY